MRLVFSGGDEIGVYDGYVLNGANAVDGNYVTRKTHSLNLC